MKKVITVVLSIVALLIVGAFGYFFYVKSSLTPTYQGEINLKGLSDEVDAYYSAHGIPHIYAEEATDAYRAFGYIHAQDRLWQMDLLRHVGAGKLSLLFGKDLVQTDKHLRTMGVPGYAQKSTQDFISRNAPALPLIQAYLDGVNAYIEANPKPLEHMILGLEVAPFTLQNVFETLTYMAFSFQKAHKTDPVLTELAQTLDTAYLEDLEIYHYEGETMIESFDTRYSALSGLASHTLQTLNVPEFVGSNSWVLSGEKTTTRKVILENDPHMGFSSPSVWYEAHVVYPGVEYYGYHIAGIPFPLLLHNEAFANGLTMFQNDDMDFFVEEIHPEDSNLYQHKGEWKQIRSVQETIEVKDDDPQVFTIRKTVHGPIVSDILAAAPMKEAVSVYWVTSNFPNYTLDALYEFSTASGLSDIETAASKIHGPGLNVMYGDSAGNVAWWASAKLLKRRNEASSKTFYDGADGVNDPNDTYPFEKNPHAINPPWGYVYSANNQPDTVAGVVYSGYYLPDDRGERIVSLLNAQDKWSVAQVKRMTLDNKSTGLSRIQSIMTQSVSGYPELLPALKAWDGTFKKEDFRPLVYQHWVYEVMKQAMQDEMGDTLWSAFKDCFIYDKSIELLIAKEQTPWWDNVHTPQVESRSDIITASLDSTLSRLTQYWGEDHTQWKWGDAHQLTHPHALGTVLSFLNLGPFPSDAGNEVLNNLGFDHTDAQNIPITFGPSTRRVIDFSDVRNNSWSILPIGQSGNYFSPYYGDQTEMYLSGEFRKMMMNHQEIQQSEKKLTFAPSK